MIAALRHGRAGRAHPTGWFYRFWCDTGYVAGGLRAVALGSSGAIAVVATLATAPKLWVVWDLPGGLSAPAPRVRPAASRAA